MPFCQGEDIFAVTYEQARKIWSRRTHVGGPRVDTFVHRTGALPRMHFQMIYILSNFVVVAWLRPQWERITSKSVMGKIARLYPSEETPRVFLSYRSGGSVDRKYVFRCTEPHVPVPQDLYAI